MKGHFFLFHPAKNKKNECIWGKKKEKKSGVRPFRGQIFCTNMHGNRSTRHLRVQVISWGLFSYSDTSKHSRTFVFLRIVSYNYRFRFLTWKLDKSLDRFLLEFYAKTLPTYHLPLLVPMFFFSIGGNCRNANNFSSFQL